MIDSISGRSRRGCALLSLVLLGATSLGAPAGAETGFYFRQPGPGIGAPAAAVGEEEAPEASPANALAPAFRARYMKAGEAYAAETASTFQASGAAPFAWDARGLPPGTRLDETDNARPATVGTPQAPGMFPIALSVTDASGARGALVAYQAVDAVPGSAMTAPGRSARSSAGRSAPPPAPSTASSASTRARASAATSRAAGCAPTITTATCASARCCPPPA